MEIKTRLNIDTEGLNALPIGSIFRLLYDHRVDGKEYYVYKYEDTHYQYIVVSQGLIVNGFNSAGVGSISCNNPTMISNESDKKRAKLYYRKFYDGNEHNEYEVKLL